MLKPTNVVKAINRATSPFLLDGSDSICLTKHSSNSFRLRITSSASKAFNNYGNDGEQINVLRWFNDFWLFIDIQFNHPVGTIVSLSVFQGEETDPLKKQLFRAEWDDFGDGENIHAQPHWHFLTNKLVENSAKQFSEFLENENISFNDFLFNEFKNTIDLSKFHFAMNGDWMNSKILIHQINDEIKLANWFGGLLSHLKIELEYVSRKNGVDIY